MQESKPGHGFIISSKKKSLLFILSVINKKYTQSTEIEVKSRNQAMRNWLRNWDGQVGEKQLFKILSCMGVKQEASEGN